MLLTGKVGLRARDKADVAVLHAELYEDVATRVQAHSRPWRPIPPGSAASPYPVTEPLDELACFSVVELDTGALPGEALLWAIDLHNRMAHLGLSLRPAFRGRGLGTDVVLSLCSYGFAIRGMHRLQVDTLASNIAMIRAASRRVRAGGQAPPVGVGQRGFRRRGDPRIARSRLGRGRKRANGRGRDRRQPRLAARSLPVPGRRGVGGYRRTKGPGITFHEVISVSLTFITTFRCGAADLSGRLALAGKADKERL